MNLILIEPADLLAPGRARLTGRRARHLVDVHRAEPGRELRVGLLGGPVGTGRVEVVEAGPGGPDSSDRGLPAEERDDEGSSAPGREDREPDAPEPGDQGPTGPEPGPGPGDDGPVVELAFTLTDPPPPRPGLDLVLALPRPRVLRRVLRSVAALGVDRVALVNSWRVDKSYWQTPALDPAAVRHELVLGLEQARDTVLPEVTLEPLFKPFVEDRLPALVAGRRALVAHPGAAAALPGPAPEPTTLCVGPEGGWIPYEVDKLVEAGCAAVTLGPRVLVVEDALTACLARLTAAAPGSPPAPAGDGP